VSYNYTGNGKDVIPANAMNTEVVAGIMLNTTLFDYGALKHKHEQAIKAAQESLTVSQRISLYRAVIANYYILGKIYKKINDPKEAQTNITAGIAFAKSKNLVELVKDGQKLLAGFNGSRKG